MLYSLKELIFGLNEFEKAKIDDRIKQAFLLVPKIKLERLEDFEILEENIYKLKEQLRIKSSNLNRVIKNNKQLPKKRVLEFIKDLETIRYDFLKEVFSKIEPNTKLDIEPKKEIQKIETQQININKTNSNENNINSINETKIEKILDKEIINEKKSEPLENNSKITSKNELELIDNQKFTLLLNNGKTPYLTIKFKEKLDLIVLKNLSSLFFEVYQMHGTNIIVENNIALIIPRFQGDELINLPQVEQDLDEIFNLIKSTQNNKLNSQQTQIQSQTQIQNEKENIQKQSEEKLIEKPIESIEKSIQQTQNQDYLKINDDFKKQEFKTKKYDEDSLDALLTKHQKENKPKDEPNITKAEKDEEILTQAKTETISFEKKEQEIKEPEVQILKNEDLDLIKKEEKKHDLEENISQQNKTEQKPVQNNEPEKPITQSVESKNQKPSQQFQFEIYRDENIIVHFKEDSKSLGTLCVTTPNGEPIHTLSENELSYLTIFSKVFAGILFEVVGCEGTNIIWNFNENMISIIPRSKDDNVLKMWELNQQKPEILEQIKEKLLTTILIEQEKNKPKTPTANQDKPKPAIEKIEGESEGEQEKRAQHLLNSLRRIP